MITAEEMSRVGLGTQHLGEKPDEYETDDGDQKRSRTLKDMFHGGINTFDTSPISGQGKSEIEIGNFVEEEHCRDNVFLSSKCGYHWDLGEDLQRDTSQERLRQELGESMNRLKVNVIDLYLLNNPPGGESLDSSVDALGQMRRDRNIRNIGLRNPSLEQLEQSLHIAPLDFIQLPVNVFDEDRLDRFRPVCEEESVEIIACDIMESNRIFNGSEAEWNEEFPSRDITMSLRDVKNNLENYFQERYPDESMDHLLASWSVHAPGVHSGIVEVNRALKLKSILRILQVNLTEGEYRKIRDILSC